MIGITLTSMSKLEPTNADENTWQAIDGNYHGHAGSGFLFELPLTGCALDLRTLFCVVSCLPNSPQVRTEPSQSSSGRMSVFISDWMLTHTPHFEATK